MQKKLSLYCYIITKQQGRNERWGLINALMKKKKETALHKEKRYKNRKTNQTNKPKMCLTNLSHLICRWHVNLMPLLSGSWMSQILKEGQKSNNSDLATFINVKVCLKWAVICNLDYYIYFWAIATKKAIFQFPTHSQSHLLLGQEGVILSIRMHTFPVVIGAGGQYITQQARQPHTHSHNSPANLEPPINISTSMSLDRRRKPLQAWEPTQKSLSKPGSLKTGNLLMVRWYHLLLLLFVWPTA